MFTVVRTRLISQHLKTVTNLLFISPTNNLQTTSKVLTIIHNAQRSSSYKPRSQIQRIPGSRYVPPSPIELAEESIFSTLKSKNFTSDEEWEDFKLDVLSEGFITEENFSSVVMNVLLASNQLDLSHSFLKYVEGCNVKPNFLTYLKYISLCSRNHRVVDQKHILKMIGKVKAKIDSSPVLDMKRAEYIIQGFCATDKWRESFNYLNKLISSKPSREICNALACAAIRNDDEKLAWDILTKWMNVYEPVSDIVIEEFLLVALKMQKTSFRESDKFIEKLLQYMQMHYVIISVDVAKLIEQYFACHDKKWNITYAKINRNGACEKCEHNLKLHNLTDQEYTDLCDAFLQRALKKSDMYINTTAKEFNTYMNFIDTYKPFHIVMDGLNAAHSLQGYQSNKAKCSHLLRVVKLLSRKSRKLLVVGRRHMKHWPGIEKVSQRAKLFFTDNISQDDPFVIYAALTSGPHTYFLSMDLMRDHLARLEDPRLIHLFKRWQLSHQVFLDMDEENNIKFVEPLRHSIMVQGSMEYGWHIPFDDKIILDPYEELNNWLCIKKCM